MAFVGPGALGALVALVALVVSMTAAPQAARAAEGDSSASLDLTIFSAGDDGGDPYKAEGMDYYGLRLAARVRVSDEVHVRAAAVGALLVNDAVQPVPPTVTGVTVTSASTTTITLDATAGVDIRPQGTGATLSVGAYYHHQYGYIAGGIDLGASQELFGGDTVLNATFSLRAAWPKRRMWDGDFFGWTRQTTWNVLVGITQNLSPSVVVGLSGQLTRQEGYLSEPFNFVVLFDEAGAPRDMVDEVLPETRTRGQVNGRLRFTPQVGTSLGLDVSFYADDWGILHGAVEPSVEMLLPLDLRLRLWTRLSWQQAAKYFVDGPVEVGDYATEDSDLGSFVLLSPGVLFIIPLGASPEELSWETRIAVFGFYRTDQMFAVGSTAGVVATW